MLADLLYYLYPYQIFKSVVFRGSLTFLTTYFIINLILPSIIRLFRQKGITSDFKKTEISSGPYRGATPIMGGIIMIPAIVISVFLWAWINQFTISLLIIITSFALIGGLDDLAKVLHKRRIESGKESRNTHSDKADGLRGDLRLVVEFIISFGVIGATYWIFDGINGQMHIPMIPMKNWFPELPTMLFVPIAMIIIVGGANAVNLTDGLDSLATVPIITCSVFIAGAAYLAGDAEWSERLKLLYISDEIKEVAIFAIAIIAACLAFLNFNSPPASIYMGDIGSLGLGATVCSMFIFVKAELYLPIIGGTFVIAAISSIIQRLWFKIALWKHGRAWAEKNRFFYKAPYHHHQQSMLTYSEEQSEINSIWHNFLLKLGMGRVPVEDQYSNREHINNKVIWKNHLRAVALLVISAMIYFKVR
ncbi:MAG: phospho-N-acetylmuramoyl-pentapeptide-transferase [Deltaproteobacteria bacterium]|jgi:phospho-N-acetylmuramoyl-pentapeptide-transferase|nr:phospho-N-acetylmuramoyl-pentapeptide-transferase [Deltaproteobacteria bacterium]MBT4089267.1 phospho-N-acetylmuramoyl-pentapeptide-transferase [Deltaproteobacteria bacterium]MBT4264852.1 phospho-N-acetylmuramoyl-pentapeptide-transferase [Deltaproteobacteria bacterium]MBT4640062.1 phospho-N-acetylmuramoyl-pentapeptide-transferase [Deltaproteobacteria bacterium]MBT6498838.1 phospho-N-acetylmuramoyl-pentapeptide-transferase [Deltaproteobacteria bacterium]